LVDIAKSVVVNGQVFNLPVHPGENSTYDLKFRGPQLRCTVSQYNNSFPFEHTSLDGLVAPAFESKWNWGLSWYGASRDAPLYTVDYYNTRWFTPQRTSNNVTSFKGFRETYEQICKPYSVLYDVNISFPRGVQTVHHSRSNWELLSPLADYGDFPRGGLPRGLELPLPPDEQALQDWNHRMQALFPLANEWALLDALGTMLEDTTYQTGFYVGGLEPDDDPNCKISSIATNGTTFWNCLGWSASDQTMNISCVSLAPSFTQYTVNAVLT
jgi:hypothetical protein